MKIETRRISAITLIILMAISIGVANAALPQMPHRFWGDVTIGGQPAHDGVLIEAKIDGETLATTTTSEGSYDFKVPSDDPDEPGGSDGDTVKFYVGGIWAADYDFEGNEITNLPLSINAIPPVADAKGPYTGTEGIPLTFDGSASYDPDGYIFTYAWTFGDEGTSDEENPTHTYDQNGTYPVTLTVTDDHGETHSASTTAEIADIDPVADFEADQLSGVEPLPVTFTDRSTSHDGIVSWLWDFGDESALSEVQSPTHTYDMNGIYTVTLMVTDSDGSIAQATEVITVTDSGPTADFEADHLSGVEPLPVVFTGTSTAYDTPMTYSWDFGDESDPVTEMSPTYVYEQDGTYPVTLTVTDADGSTDTETITITVTDSEPVAAFTADHLSGDEPLTVTFTSTSESHDEITYFWEFGDGENSTLETVSHTYCEDGTYHVWLTVTDADGDFDTATTTIIVSDTDPEAAFEASPLMGTEPLTVNFTITSESHDEITYFWDFGDGDNSTLESPSYVYEQEGTYTVSLTIYESDGDEDTEIKIGYITVTPIDIEDFKEEEIAGGQTDYVVNATAETDTTVTLNTTATTTVTVIKYAENPHPDDPMPESVLPKYVDIVISDPDAVEWPIRVEMTYTDEEAAEIYEEGLGIYYWKAGEWQRCSDTGVDTENNIIWAEMTEVEASGSPIIPGSHIPSIVYQISLEEDWNLISLPLIPVDPSVTVILADIIADVESVWAYDADTGLWASYSPGAPSDLTEMVEGRGYWMDMSASAVLSVSGTEISKEPPLPSYQLMEGWNLIGMPYVPEDASIDVVFSGILEHIESIWCYDAGVWSSYSPYAPSDLTDILDGKGYWIKMTTDALWEIDID